MSFGGFLKQGVAVTIPLGPMVSASDGVTPMTALTLNQAAVRVSKNGGAFAQKSDATAAAHMESGNYSGVFNATDIDTMGIITVECFPAATVPFRKDYAVVAPDFWDQLHNLTGPVAHLGIMDRGTAQAATANSVRLRAGTPFAADNAGIRDSVVMVYSTGQGYWQARAVTAFSNATKDATVDAWDVTPTGVLTYVVFAGAPASTTNPAPVHVVSVATDAITATSTASSFVSELAQAVRAEMDANSGVFTSMLSALSNILAKVTPLPSDPADASDIAASTNALATSLVAISNAVAAVHTKTTNLPASPAAVGSAMTLQSGERTTMAELVLLTMGFFMGHVIKMDEEAKEVVLLAPDKVTELGRAPFKRDTQSRFPVTQVGDDT